MDPSLIRKALEAIRGGGQPTAAPQQAAPSAVAPGADLAYGQPPSPPIPPQVQNMPFKLDQPLEEKMVGQGAQNEMDPILQQILKRLGMLNVIRNQSNQTMDAGFQG